ncbi:MAG: TonB-dependent receptor [Pseudohongiella sp.]|nr:TonB-dependent receptor [Pseudohongiella sp.]
MSTHIPNFAPKKGLRYFIALCAGTASLSALPTIAFSQDELIEEVVVTGSRIRQNTNATSSQPLSTISGVDLTQTSTVDIAEILNDNPALLSSVTGSNSIDDGASNVDNASNVGGSSLDLRGLGYERTLTLVNGRRHVSGIEGTSAVDVSTIPASLIERVEVLTGGASAVYGADAVTGVVNFVLKDDYEGFEIDARTTLSEERDGETSNIDVLFGRNFNENRGNITVALQYNQSEGMRQGDRFHTANDRLYNDDVNPALRFQTGNVSDSATPNFAQFYNFDNTGRFPVGGRIPSAENFIADYTAEFGAAPTLTSGEMALINQASSAFPRAMLPGRSFNITSPYGVVAAGDFGLETALGSEPDLDGNGTPDCLDSFTGYNSSLGGASSFGAAGGCWVIDQNGGVGPYQDGLVAGNFNQFGNSQSFIAPNRPYTIPADEKYAINLNGNYDLNDSVQAFFETKYVKHEVEFGGGGHNFTDLLRGAPDNPYLPLALQPLANNGGVGFVGDGGLRISRDSDDWGSNIDTNERTTTRFVAGLRGTLESLDLDYELSVNYGKFERKLIDREEMIADRFFAAIDAVTDPATGQAVCRSSLDATAYPPTTPFDIFSFVGGGVDSSFFTFAPGDGQCQPMNIWGGRGAMSQESVDFVTYTRSIEEQIEQSVVSGFVSGDSSQWFELPAGPISFVVGGEWREEMTSQQFDNFDQGILPVSGVTSDGIAFAAGDYVGDISKAASLGGTPSQRLLSGSSDYDVFDVFAEVEVPLIADVGLMKELTVSAAVRSADYSTFGQNTTYKIGGVWAPYEDLRFRVNYSEAVRVPNLFELFSPEQGASFRPADPCDISQISSAGDPAQRQSNCVASLQSFNVPAENIFDANGNYIFADPLSAGFPGVVGGNSSLQPEEAATETYGFVYEPSFIDGLMISMDYWDITIDGAISEISDQNIVNSCYDAASINNPFCDLFSRNPESTSAQSGGFTFLRQTLLNFGSAQATGVDYAIAYQFYVEDLQFNIGAGATRQRRLEFVQPAAPGEEAMVDDELGEMRRPEWAGQLNASVSTGPLTVALSTSYLSKQTLNYEGGVEIETVDQNYGPSAYTDEFFTHNLTGQYSLNDNFLLYGGVTNLTDEDPYLTERGYPVSVMGRSYFLGVNYAF